ncbi:hypothetical protein D322_2085 [Yersinia enterocolitica IP 10393]|nr:hypothetical protein D322_2085 [Yersinia enterocolitica IP 10393]
MRQRIFILSIRTLWIAAGYFVLSIAITEPVNSGPTGVGGINLIPQQ